MAFMITIYGNDTGPGTEPGTPEFDGTMAAGQDGNERLVAGGHGIAGASWQPRTTARTVRTGGAGPVFVTDAPFAETKEQIGGFT